MRSTPNDLIDYLPMAVSVENGITYGGEPPHSYRQKFDAWCGSAGFASEKTIFCIKTNYEKNMGKDAAY